MDTLDCRYGNSAAVSEPPGTRSGKETLALVACWDEMCGIAAYARTLERNLAEHFAITVFDLDQFLLRNTHPRIRSKGNEHIEDICRQLGHFDAVNIQLEHGTLGGRPRDIVNRFCRLVEAAPRLSVTFHTFNKSFLYRSKDILDAVVRLNFAEVGRKATALARARRLCSGIMKPLRRAQCHKTVSAIMHTAQDAREMRLFEQITNVYDHPLTFLREDQVDEFRATTESSRFPLLEKIPTPRVLIGVFGFLGAYKGFDTVLRAMQHLPDTHHLLLFGSVHPNDIVANRAVHPYLATLFDEGYVGATIVDRLGRNDASSDVGITIECQDADRLHTHPRDVSKRIHFMGSMNDEEFARGMTLCDVVVFPYVEVGQSASGPISMAVELGCRVVASRTKTFLRFGKYHPDRIEFFDIGNHLELAGRIAARPQFQPPYRFPSWNTETNNIVYRSANSAAQSPMPPSSSPRRTGSRQRSMMFR